MKKIFLLFGLFLLVLPFKFFGQQNGWFQEITGPGNEKSGNITKSSDGDYAFLLSASEGLDGGQGTGMYFVKIDESGNTLATKRIDSLLFYFDDSSIHSTPDNGYLILTNKIYSGAFGFIIPQPYFIKLDENGNEEWAQHYFLNNIDTITTKISSVQSTSDGGFIIAANHENPSLDELEIIKLDGQLNEEWAHNTSLSNTQTHSIAELSTGEFAVSGTTFNAPVEYFPFLFKINSQGNQVWFSDFNNPIYDYRTRMKTFSLDNGEMMTFISKTPIEGWFPEGFHNTTLIKSDNSGSVIGHYNLGLISYYGIESIVQVENGFVFSTSVPITFDVTGTYYIKLTEVSDFGVIQWNHLIAYDNPETCTSMAYTDDNGIIGVATFDYDGPASNRESFAFKVDSLGQIFANFITGKIARDEQINCTVDGNELVLPNFWVSATKGNDTYYAISDSLGEYRFTLDTGEYIITLHPPNNLWTPCDNEVAVEVESDSTSTLDFSMETISDCPLLVINSSFPIARPCFDNNTMVVQYCNEGTQLAENAYVKIEIDEDLSYVNSSISLTSQNGNLLTFDIGNVDVTECGSFTVTYMLDCETELGEDICIQSHIYPDTTCLPTNPNWNGAFVEVDIECQDSLVNFYLENTGSADMPSENEYIVIEDAILLISEPFQLAEGEVETFSLPANGSTYRIIAEQVEFAPGDPFPTAYIEDCNYNSMNSSSGFVNQFSLGDDTPFWDNECTIATSSFDPNDKQGFPVGYDDGSNYIYYIRPNTDLEYLIRFQNTGSDTAFTVKIRDKISPNLDISSIKVGASSHPYEWRIYDKDILEFTFNVIMLPDSNVNEPASHGFVEFKISHKEDLPLGSLIWNTAAIYFDYNDPIFTNETLHKIEENFITVSTQRPIKEDYSLLVRPNPFQGFAIFEMKKEIKDGLFELYDVTGKLAWQQKFSGSEFELKRNTLTAGIYFYKISGNGNAINSGKIIIN